MQVRTQLTRTRVSRLRSLRQVKHKALSFTLGAPSQVDDCVDATLQDVEGLVLERRFFNDIVKATILNNNDNSGLTANANCLAHVYLQ